MCVCERERERERDRERERERERDLLKLESNRIFHLEWTKWSKTLVLITSFFLYVESPFKDQCFCACARMRILMYLLYEALFQCNSAIHRFRIDSVIYRCSKCIKFAEIFQNWNPLCPSLLRCKLSRILLPSSRIIDFILITQNTTSGDPTDKEITRSNSYIFYMKIHFNLYILSKDALVVYWMLL